MGGSLSCVLFMLYANDLSLHTPDGVTIVQYADDTQILVNGKKHDLASIISLMEATLDILYRWFCQNGLKVNMAKTQMLVLCTPAMLRNLPPITVVRSLLATPLIYVTPSVRAQVNCIVTTPDTLTLSPDRESEPRPDDVG